MSAGDHQAIETRKGMFCYACGGYTIQRRALAHGIGSFACPVCGYQWPPTRVLPLFIVTGASGAGKTTIIQPLQQRLNTCGVFDKDQIWATNWDMVMNNFFRVASALAQGSRHTVIVGTIVPDHLAGLSDRDLVSDIYYINLHCDDQTRRNRLLTRRKWGLPDEDFIQAHARFAARLLIDAGTMFGHPMPTIDTSAQTPEAVAEQVAVWVENLILAAQPGAGIRPLSS